MGQNYSLAPNLLHLGSLFKAVTYAVTFSIDLGKASATFGTVEEHLQFKRRPIRGGRRK